MSVNRVKENITKITYIQAIAFSRNKWIEKVQYFLEGALGEYAKIKYANVINFGDYWSNEVKKLLKKVDKMLDSSVKTKSNFDRSKALQEAFDNASTAQNQILQAKNEFLREYLDTPKDRKDFIDKVRSSSESFDVEDLLPDMLSEFSPHIIDML